MSKLKPIAETVSEYLFDKFQIQPIYEFEKELSWLTTNPNPIVFEEGWPIINMTYKQLTNELLDLDQLSKELIYESSNGNQKVDIWFSSPYNFILEFDEKQHFNQFRSLTLTNYSEDWVVGDLSHYKSVCEKKTAKPGTSGFQKIKENLLFPHFYDNQDEQDNRIRQRAFRDFLKDYLPKLKKINPTLRIPYTVTNKKIKDFNRRDLDSVTNYITKFNLEKMIKIEKYHS